MREGAKVSKMITKEHCEPLYDWKPGKCSSTKPHHSDLSAALRSLCTETLRQECSWAEAEVIGGNKEWERKLRGKIICSFL